MPEHKSPTQVTLSTGEGTSELHGVVARYWKPAAILVGIAATVILVSVVKSERRVKAAHSAWNRVRKDVQFGFMVEPAPTAVLGGLEEELAGSKVVPWIRAISIGGLLEEGKSAAASDSARSLASSWPDHALSRVGFFSGESGGPRMSLPAWIESALATSASFEEARKDLSANPVPSEMSPRVVIKTTVGDIVVALFADLSPRHAENFLKLCSDGFYDGTRIHRLVQGQYLEAGDPNSRTEGSEDWGTGGPGYSIPHEGAKAWNYKYAVTSVQADDNYSSNGSQFRIMLSDVHSFDGASSVFGVVVDGTAVLDELGAAEVSGARPTNPVTIQSTEVMKADRPG